MRPSFFVFCLAEGVGIWYEEGLMKNFNRKAAQICGMICIVPMLLVSCSSADPDYSQWGDRPQIVDAGPRAVTAMGSEDAPIEIESTEPVAPRGRRSPPASVVMEKNKKPPAKDFQGWLQGRY